MDEPGEDSCYGILGVDPSASSSEIRQATDVSMGLVVRLMLTPV